MKSLSDWLSYLERLHPKAIDLGLARVRQVAQQLNLLPFPIFTMTVTGTNGKGSCCLLLENILIAHGLRVGTYTSPHLLHYNERIRIQQIEIDDDALCQAFEQIEQARAHVSLTYFEFGTLAALLLFKQAALDVVILEVGMGGRLDAVNIVDADIAVISTIAIDHAKWLGTNREAIGYEKAGIMRPQKPVVCGDSHPPQSMIQYAQKIGAPLYIQKQDFDFSELQQSWCWHSHTQAFTNLPLPKIELQNASTVLKVIELIKARWPISYNDIAVGLNKVFLYGRFQVLKAPVTYIFDVAHNPAAGVLLAKKLQVLPKGNRTLAVCAMLTDKDQPGTVSSLIDLIDAWYVGGLEVLPRGSSANLLADCLREQGAREVAEYATVVQALQNAEKKAEPGDRILIFGSFHTVAEVIKLKFEGDFTWK